MDNQQETNKINKQTKHKSIYKVQNKKCHKILPGYSIVYIIKKKLKKNLTKKIFNFGYQQKVRKRGQKFKSKARTISHHINKTS